MSHIDRRDFLRTAAYGAGLGLIPASIQRALALPAITNKGTVEDVQHVVILMQENRSFDHYFGTMPGVRGFGDRFTIPLPNGASVWQQNNGKRTVLPFYLDSTQGKALGIGTPHSWDDAHAAWDHGRMTSWPIAKTNFSMGYLKPADLDFHTALANAFTLCDHYHCALHGGTNSNRIYHWTGTNHGPQASSNGARVAVINNDGWDTCSGTPLADSLTWTTYPERLEAAGVSWKIYQQLPDNYTDNPLSGFKTYRDCYARVNNGNLATYSDISAGPSVPYLPTMDVKGSPNYEPLYKGIGNTETDYGNYLALFTADAAADRLPQVSWIVGPAQYTEHPDYTPAQGAYFIQRILDALTANPTVWGKTVLFINYDENDGYFDHLPPPNPPSAIGNGQFAGKSTTDTRFDYLTMPVAKGSGAHASDGLPHGAGPRVPMFVVSPFSRGGYVNSQAFDHTSVLQFLEQRFGVVETNITPWRRAVFGNLMSAFDFANPNTSTTDLVTSLPRQNLATAEAQYLQQSSSATVPVPAENAQLAPIQPTGTRPARALPYESNVLASADASGRPTLQFVNSGTVGALFHVYDRLHLELPPRRYTVEAGKQLSDTWAATGPASAYDLWVLGANGFHRLFRGAAATAGLEIGTRYDTAKKTLLLTLINAGATPAVFTVTAGAYRSDGPWVYTVPAADRREQSFDLTSAQGWYDFTVRAAGGFTRRVAGHLETGAVSVSDPAMAAPEVVTAFTYPEKTDLAPGSLAESAAVALSGFPGYLPISVSPGAEFSIDGGAFVSSAPNVCTGQSIAVRHPSATALKTATTSTLTIGSYSTPFKSTTAAVQPPSPSVPAPTPAPTPSPATPSPTTPGNASPPVIGGAAPVPATGSAANAAADGRFGGGALGSLALAGLAAAAGFKRLRDDSAESE